VLTDNSEHVASMMAHIIKMNSSLSSRWIAPLFAVWLSLCAIILSPSAAFAADAFMVDVVRSPAVDKTAISATLKNGFSKEIRENIDSGAPVVFTYFIELKRIRTVIWNETVKKMTLKRMVKFDPLHKVYMMWEKKGEDEADIAFNAELASVDHREKPKESSQSASPMAQAQTAQQTQSAMEPVVTMDQDKMEIWMTRLENVEIGSAASLKNGARHYFRVRCEMYSIKLMPPFNYILFFVALWNFDTDWEISTPFVANHS